MSDNIESQDKFIDVLQMMPSEISGRKVIAEDMGDKVILYLPASGKFGGGRESKKVTINRMVSLDSLL